LNLPWQLVRSCDGCGPSLYRMIMRLLREYSRANFRPEYAGPRLH
jgi:hypothetical protein